MSTVQVAVSFAVEIWKFHNIDLFNQGSFHIRTYFKTNGLAPVIIEAPKIWTRSKHVNFPVTQSSYISEPDSKANIPPKAVSKSVVIIYKEESLKMYDVVEQTMHFQIEASSIDEMIYKSDLVLVVELWFGEKKNDIYLESKCVCERHLKVHFRPSQGLHHHLTVMFDYYYLAAVELVVHGSLVSISPCYLRVPFSSKTDAVSNPDKNYTLYQSWHSILFNTGKSIGKRHTACLIYSQICQLLLMVIENLMNNFKVSLNFHSLKQRTMIEEKIRSQLFPTASQSDDNYAISYWDFTKKAWMKFAPNELERMSSILQAQTSEEDISDQASIDITKLSSKILVLFNEFLKTACYHPSYVESLSIHTHRLRIKRFSEAFFFQESPLVHLLAVFDPNANNSHEALANRIRSSPYYRRLPPLPIECPDTDGESHDQPIIFEEIYRPEGSSSPLFLLDHGTKNNAGRHGNKQKKRPVSDIVDMTQKNKSNEVPRTGSLYMKKTPSKRPEQKSIPVMRKLNPNHKNMDSPLTTNEKSINLVGFRALENTAFSDISSTTISQLSNQSEPKTSAIAPIKSVGEPSIANQCTDGVVMRNKSITNVKQGLGTLRQVNGYESNSNLPSTNVSTSINNPTFVLGSQMNLLKLGDKNSLSRSMPDLSYMDEKTIPQMIKKVGVKFRPQQKKSEHRFKSIYELDESQSVTSYSERFHAPSNATLSRSYCNLFTDQQIYGCNRVGSTNSDRCDNQGRNRKNNGINEFSSIVNDKRSSLTPSTIEDDSKLTIYEMLVHNKQSASSNASPKSKLSNPSQPSASPSSYYKSPHSSCSSPVMSDLSSLSTFQPHSSSSALSVLTFGKLKSNLMSELRTQLPAILYSDLPELPAASLRPYFCMRDFDGDEDRADGVKTNSDDSDDCGLRTELHRRALLNLQRKEKKGTHLIICVHGLDGEHRDLRLVRAYLSLALPEEQLEFLMSQANEGETFGDIEGMVERLVTEVADRLKDMRELPTKISFIGHSLGCLLVRGAASHKDLSPYFTLFHTFLSLGGPHLGTLYGSSLLVNAGLWFMQRLKKSLCLQQLALKDSTVNLDSPQHQQQRANNSQTSTNENTGDPRKSLLYQMSGWKGLDLFKFVLLAGSPQDRYVPYHSTRIELCPASVKDSSEMGVIYMEMVTKLLQRILQSGKTTVVRYDAHYTLPRSANNYIGRAAHIALIDSELFLEKFISVSAAKYFR